MNKALYDNDFLKKLDKNRNKTIYIKIISLTQNEAPIEAIEGVVQSGSINVDGSSSVRRTCNLTLTTQKLNINEIYWGFSTKIKIFIGVENTIDSNYDNIIWFPQGVYILTDFKTSQSINAYTITISGKDKMCLLNGDIGGHFNAETNLKIENYVDTSGTITEIVVPIKRVIREMIHHYAQEPWHNIIINNVSDYGLQMLDNATDDTYYLLQDSYGTYKYLLQDNIVNDTGIVNGQIRQIINENETSDSYDSIKTLLDNNTNFIFLNSIEEDQENIQASKVELISNEQVIGSFYVYKSEPKTVIGYSTTDLVYDKDLIAAAGDTITSILDKLVQFLGPFEYFYDLDGRFVFQAKPTYLNTAWEAQEELDTITALSYITPATLESKVSYIFDDDVLLTAIQNNPQLLNIRNDFTIWGKKRSASGTEIPIHLRYAVDKKPLFYYSKTKASLYVTEDGEKILLYHGLDPTMARIVVDWRELIYCMAEDYYKWNHSTTMNTSIGENDPIELEQEIIRNNAPFSKMIQTYDYLTGKTGYEQYYHDIEGFWRQLYNPDKKEDVDNTLGIIYDTNGWNTMITEDPSSLIFWFDFYDINTLFGQFSVPAIGARTKVVNDGDVRVIVYPAVPNVIFTTQTALEAAYAANTLNTGYSYIVYSDDKLNSFSLSTRRKSAKETMDSLLQQHSCTNDSISLTSIPIYYLEPNSIIYVYNQLSHIDGYYLATKFTIPLSYNGTMTITADKIPQQIY